MQKHLSAETIYVGLYVLPQRALLSELPTALRQAREGVDLGRERPIISAKTPHMTPMAERPAKGSRPHGTGPLGRQSHHGSPQWLGRQSGVSGQSKMIIHLASPHSRSTLLAHVHDTRSLTRRIPPRQ